MVMTSLRSVLSVWILIALATEAVASSSSSTLSSSSQLSPSSSSSSSSSLANCVNHEVAGGISCADLPGICTDDIMVAHLLCPRHCGHCDVYQGWQELLIKDDFPCKDTDSAVCEHFKDNHGDCDTPLAKALCRETCAHVQAFTCRDHVTNPHCGDIPGVCNEAYGVLLCPKYCELCDAALVVKLQSDETCPPPCIDLVPPSDCVQKKVCEDVAVAVQICPRTCFHCNPPPVSTLGPPTTSTVITTTPSTTTPTTTPSTTTTTPSTTTTTPSTTTTTPSTTATTPSTTTTTPSTTTTTPTTTTTTPTTTTTTPSTSTASTTTTTPTTATTTPSATTPTTTTTTPSTTTTTPTTTTTTPTTTTTTPTTTTTTPTTTTTTPTTTTTTPTTTTTTPTTTTTTPTTTTTTPTTTTTTPTTTTTTASTTTTTQPTTTTTTGAPNNLPGSVCVVCGDPVRGRPCSALDLVLARTKQCPPAAPYCMTDISQTSVNGQTVVSQYKRCVDEPTCHSLWFEASSDVKLCTGYDPNASTDDIDCHLCCYGNQCNLLDVPPRNTWYHP